MNALFNHVTVASFLAFAAASPAFAAPAPTVCSVTDLTPNAVACAGFVAGNVLSNNAGDITTQKAELALLGFTWSGTNFGSLEKLTPLSGTHTVDFSTLLHGVTYVGIHFGGGTGGPGNATAFYKLNAGTSLDTFSLRYNASSTAVLYSTSPAAPVPEPESLAMMVSGLLALGWLSRRRNGKR